MGPIEFQTPRPGQLADLILIAPPAELLPLRVDQASERERAATGSGLQAAAAALDSDLRRRRGHDKTSA